MLMFNFNATKEQFEANKADLIAAKDSIRFRDDA